MNLPKHPAEFQRLFRPSHPAEAVTWDAHAEHDSPVADCPWCIHPAEVVAAAQDTTLAQILEDVADGNELQCGLCDRVLDLDEDVLVTALVGNAVRPICPRCDAMESD